VFAPGVYPEYFRRETLALLVPSAVANLCGVALAKT